MAPYPAKNTKEASELLIDVSNQLHEVVNESATSEILTDSGLIPSVRKALADTFLFQQPIPWQQGQTETAFNQLRTFGANLYWAPSATLDNPITMGATPEGDNNWPLAPVFVNVDSFAHKELKTVTSVHDLDIPFNDGIELTHGYGPLTFSRLSEATGTNKSGIPQTCAQDLPVITSSGIACFGEVTNYVPSWNEVAWAETTFTPTPQKRLIERNVASTPDGLMEADRITASQDSDLQRIYFSVGGVPDDINSWSVTVKADISDRIRIQTSVTSKFVEVSLVDGSVINNNANYEVEPLVDGWFRITIYGNIRKVGWVQLLDSNNSATFDGSVTPASVLICNAQMSSGAFVPPPIPTSGAAVTRKPDIATVPQIGNLPRPDDPFYIVVDVDARVAGFETILGKIYGSTSSLALTPTSQLRLTLPNGSGSTQLINSSVIDPKLKRIITSFDGSNVSFYVDGELSGGGVMPNKFNEFDYSGDMYIGRLNDSGQYEYPLNGHLKNLKIKHGVMTDDLAKAYGKWGD